jgi:uncharacterized protein (TIGR03083 family)
MLVADAAVDGDADDDRTDMGEDLRTIGITDRAALEDAIEAEGLRLGRLLHRSGPGRAGIPVPGLDWTVAETAAHALTVVRRALGDRTRSASPAETAEINAASLRALPGRDPVTIGMEIARDTGVVARRVLPQVVDGDALIPFHGGMRVRALDAFGVLLAELVVHGHDLARALGVGLETPNPHAAAALRAMLAVAPGWLDPGCREPERAYQLDVAGLPAVVEARVTGGGLELSWAVGATRSPDPVDPVTALLALAHREPANDPSQEATAQPGLAGLAASLLPL